MHFRNFSSTSHLLPRQATSSYAYSDRLSTLGDDDEDEDGVDLSMTLPRRRAWQVPIQPQQQQQLEERGRQMNDHEIFSSPRPPTTLQQSPSGLIPSRTPTTTPVSATSAAVTPTLIGQSKKMQDMKPKSKSRQARKLRLPLNHHRRTNNEKKTEKKKKSKSSSKKLSPKVASQKQDDRKDRVEVVSRPPRQRTEGPIEVPHDHDVLSGRGVNIYRHSGNLRFQKFVSEWKEEYIMKTLIKDKPKIVQMVIDMLERLDPPGRFLELKDPQNLNGTWIEMDRKKVLAKVSQALREGATSIRRAEQFKGKWPVDGVHEGSKPMYSLDSSSSDSEGDSAESHSSKSSLSGQQQQSSESDSDSNDDEEGNDETRSYSENAKKLPVKNSPASKKSTAAIPAEKKTIFKKVMSPTGASKSLGVEEYCPTLKRQIIFEPRSTDVISGRGAAIYQHSGNKLLRDIVKERKETYILKAARHEKVEMVQEVMDVINGLDPPGRFLELRDPPKDEKGNNVWVIMDETKALSKISQLLREGATQVRRTTGTSGNGNVEGSGNENDYEEGLIPTKKQAIMRLAVEKLCPRTGEVLQVYADAEEARRSVTNTTNRQPFIKALRGKGKCGREYHGYFWRVLGSKESPQTSSLNDSAFTTAGSVSVSSFRKRRTGAGCSSSSRLSRLSKRARSKHISEFSAAESDADSSSEFESEDDSSEDDSESSEEVNPHDAVEGMDADEDDEVDIGQMRD